MGNIKHFWDKYSYCPVIYDHFEKSLHVLLKSYKNSPLTSSLLIIGISFTCLLEKATKAVMYHSSQPTVELQVALYHTTNIFMVNIVFNGQVTEGPIMKGLEVQGLLLYFQKYRNCLVKHVNHRDNQRFFPTFFYYIRPSTENLKFGDLPFGRLRPPRQSQP